MVETSDNLQARLNTVRHTLSMEIQGRISALTGLTVEVRDFAAPLGAQCRIVTRNNTDIPAEVIGFRNNVSILMPLAEMTGIACGDWVTCNQARAQVPVGENLLGRILNGAGEPIDGQGPLLCPACRSVVAEPLRAMKRKRIDSALGTGIRAIDTMMTCGRGQRMGIFSGPGVGKSVLLGMIARYTSADVNVIGLVGERGREVREFIEKDLGPEGLSRSVVVVSTSDEPAPIRVRAGFIAATLAEYFRDQGKDVLLLMDSVTRIAMAQRQIGLALGEPPATRGYTPSVFALLPRLLERSGRGEMGSITGFYSVLVEGDDISEPISDSLRGILDGHLWLSRNLANRGHYPAIDILESISRVMPDIVDGRHRQYAQLIVQLTAVYRDIEDLVNIGAYAMGTSPEYDLAVQSRDSINRFLQQVIEEGIPYDQALKELEALANGINANKPKTANVPLPGQGQTSKENAGPLQTAAGLDRMLAGV
ncbi:MAG: FliI/YscN family ATPase [Sedimentisphaerales bacterium]|nr:FliI/YscN family ATPase [Sedimentisphaerales bacterium]